MSGIFENKKNNTAIAIMHVPKRKNKALCVFEEPNEWIVVATFPNNRQAFIFEKYLERFLGETE
ncbi:MAG: hypothetical protein IJJ01_07525 [Firmicutes bacterium]|nr:hypothetical protein [Bacillota bacterium]